MKKEAQPELELFGLPSSAAKARELARQVQVQLAPGQRIVPLQHQEPGQMLVFDLQPIGGSDFRAVARVHDRWIRLTTENVRKLGLGVGYKTLRRLMEAGFITGCQPAPRTLIMDLDSYYAHIEACKADPDFWTPARHKKYLEARDIVN